MDSLMKYISRIHRCAGGYRAARLRDADIHSCQHIYIFHICRQPGISQEQLAGRLCVNKSNVTRQLTALQQNGYVTRSPDPDDKRLLRVYPTDKALALFPQVKQLMCSWTEQLLADFSLEEKAALQQMLARAMDKAISLSQSADAEAGGDGTP